MHDQAAVTAGKRLGKARRQDSRRRAGDHRIRRSQAIKPPEYCTLHFDIFGRALLDVVGTIERALEASGR